LRNTRARLVFPVTTGVMLAREPTMICREFYYYCFPSKLKKSLAGGFDDVPESSVTVFSDFRGGKSRARLSGSWLDY